MAGSTVVSLAGDSFLINGQPTYPGREWRGHRMEGLLMNARLVQGIFDDLNLETRVRWEYPDGPWDPERNTREFLAAMPVWREHGLLSFTINLQGGSPTGYAAEQPWENSAFTPEGELRAAYLDRLARILERADALGMAPIVGFLYFGQEPRLQGEAAVLRAVTHATDWLLARGYRHVLVEIANEVNVASYAHEIVKPERCHELIRLVQERSAGRVDSPAGRLLVSASMSGNALPPPNLMEAGDFVLLHGNGVEHPARIREMVAFCRGMAEYRGQPILFNEDDHFDFDQPDNNMIAAVESRAGWGLFDWRFPGEAYEEGFQCVPVDWDISSERKRGFFRLLREMTGG